MAGQREDQPVTALFTDNAPLLLAALPEHLPDVDRRFDVLAFSCVLGATKPAAEAFTAAMFEEKRNAASRSGAGHRPTRHYLTTAPNADHSVWWFFGLGGRFEGAKHRCRRRPGPWWPGAIPDHL